MGTEGGFSRWDTRWWRGLTSGWPNGGRILWQRGGEDPRRGNERGMLLLPSVKGSLRKKRSRRGRSPSRSSWGELANLT